MATRPRDKPLLAPGNPRDRNDLLGLAEVHGELPHESIPGLDG